MSIKAKYFFLFFGIITLCLHSQIRLPSVFSSNMVLQQDEEVAFWGKDIPGTKIIIRSSWGANATAFVNSDSLWQTTIQTKKASFKPHELKIDGSSSITLKNILIGEVWFCSGQSNMEMPLKGLGKSKVLNADTYLQKSDNKFIRLFNNVRTASITPNFDINGEWEESNKDSAYRFSAIGYIFGSELFDSLKVPIGIIESSWGGTRIESWIPKEKLIKYSNIKFVNTLPLEKNKQKKPALLYNAMIAPFKDFKVKGFLWYQGESNRTNPEPYENYMEDLISSWRTQWNDDSLPFYFVQIAPFDYKKLKNGTAIRPNLIREAQLRISQTVKNTELVVTTDAGDCSDIHPSKKEIVAKRLADLALVDQYNFNNIFYKSPQLDSYTFKKGGEVNLKFKFFNNDYFISNSANDIIGFTIAGADKVFYPAKVSFQKNRKQIVLTSENVEKPVAIRYGFEACFESNLKTKSGLPIPVFRTDDW